MIEISGLTLILIRAVLLVFIGLVTYIVVPWLNTLKSNWYVSAAVKAAEFVYKKAVKAGPEKRNYVIAWLQKRGIHIDKETLDTLINSVLQEIDKKPKEQVINIGSVIKNEDIN